MPDRQLQRDRFPWDSWTMDDPARVADPRLILLAPWRFNPTNGYWAGSYQLRESLIPGTSQTQVEAWRPGYDQAVFRVGPENDWPDTDTSSYPKEATMTLYLSRKRWYDCYVDLSVNRLSDPNLPKFVQFLRGDGLRVPSWNVQYRKDSGAYTDLITCDPDGDDHRFIAHQGSVANRLTEVANPENLTEVTDSGDYYLDSTSTVAPLAENGMVELRLNPYSSAEGCMTWQSFSDRTHRYVKVKTSGVWGAWGLVTVT